MGINIYIDEAYDNNGSTVMSLGAILTRGLVFYSELSIEELFSMFKGWHPERYHAFVNLKGEDLFIEIRKEKYKDSVKARIIPSPINGFYIGFSKISGAELRNILKPFFKKYYPDISRVFFNTYELFMILRHIEQVADQATIIIDKYVAYETLLYEAKEKRSEVTYTGEDYQSVFERSISEGKRLDKITFTVYIREKPFLIGRICRDGEFACTNFEEFSRLCLLKMIKLALEKRRKLSNRSREISVIPKPLTIRYEQNLFWNKISLKEVVKLLTNYSKASVGINHANPFLHAEIVDYSDGSSFEIIIASPNSIKIIPQIRSTPDALSRIIEYLSEKFGEGEITYDAQ